MNPVPGITLNVDQDFTMTGREVWHTFSPGGRNAYNTSRPVFSQRLSVENNGDFLTSLTVHNVVVSPEDRLFLTNSQHTNAEKVERLLTILDR